jgi:hypothetical protein
VISQDRLLKDIPKFFRNILYNIRNSGEILANIKYNLEIAQKIFKEGGCELLEYHYVNCSTPMKCRCSCGRLDKKTLTDFMSGKRCRQCGLDKHRYTFDEVYESFKKMGCELLSKTYCRSTEKLKYRCSCGNISMTEFRIFLSGNRCRKCSRDRACQTNRKHHGGKMHFQTKKFKTWKVRLLKENPKIEKQRMDSIRATNRKKYGHDYFLASDAGKMAVRAGLKRNYGVEYGFQSKIIYNKFKATLLKKYGVPNLAYLSRCASKQSQGLFCSIQQALPKSVQKKSHFATQGGEFIIRYKDKYYKYDFVNSTLKKAIEFNGKNFHPTEDMPNGLTGWCAFHPEKTAKEARDYERLKYEGLQKRGFGIFTVWDYQYRKNPEAVLKQCLNFLMTNPSLLSSSRRPKEAI